MCKTKGMSQSPIPKFFKDLIPTQLLVSRAQLCGQGARSWVGFQINSSSTETKSRKEREKETEQMKLRERHPRAITSRMLAGLQQYGNFPLPSRADMNNVIAALAREAGWTFIQK
ncbi:30S ribosomal protein S2 [Striga asiatica]|uniref:Protein BZR1 homolog n=1 Tax=Striga asiatica TaxID=4170 RepID=A0A5A7P8D3_STRAF|nr:30S ribosomal protein S2 [Striga asiatica]